MRLTALLLSRVLARARVPTIREHYPLAQVIRQKRVLAGEVGEAREGAAETTTNGGGRGPDMPGDFLDSHSGDEAQDERRAIVASDTRKDALQASEGVRGSDVSSAARLVAGQSREGLEQAPSSALALIEAAGGSHRDGYGKGLHCLGIAQGGHAPEELKEYLLNRVFDVELGAKGPAHDSAHLGRKAREGQPRCAGVARQEGAGQFVIRGRPANGRTGMIHGGGSFSPALWSASGKAGGILALWSRRRFFLAPTKLVPPKFEGYPQ
jgi:hypothetical protein